MAKRFIDTKIWDKSWFRQLHPKLKLFYYYMISKCNHAGVWADVDIELAGAGFEEPYVEDVPDEPKEKYTDNVLQFKLKNKKDDNEDD